MQVALFGVPPGVYPYEDRRKRGEREFRYWEKEMFDRIFSHPGIRYALRFPPGKSRIDAVDKAVASDERLKADWNCLDRLASTQTRSGPGPTTWDYGMEIERRVLLIRAATSQLSHETHVTHNDEDDLIEVGAPTDVEQQKVSIVPTSYHYNAPASRADFEQHEASLGPISYNSGVTSPPAPPADVEQPKASLVPISNDSDLRPSPSSPTFSPRRAAISASPSRVPASPLVRLKVGVPRLVIPVSAGGPMPSLTLDSESDSESGYDSDSSVDSMDES